jgi:hypothetical protein
LKRFDVTSNISTGPASIDADHFSVNGSTGGVQFYRYPPKTDRRDTRLGAERPKDDLIAVAPGGSFVKLDEKTTVLEAVIMDLTEEMADELAEKLGVPELDDNQKIRVAITFVSE